MTRNGTGTETEIEPIGAIRGVILTVTVSVSVTATVTVTATAISTIPLILIDTCRLRATELVKSMMRRGTKEIDQSMIRTAGAEITMIETEIEIGGGIGIATMRIEIGTAEGKGVGMGKGIDPKAEVEAKAGVLCLTID